MESTGQQIYQIGFEALQRVFSPEWINRLDEIVAFRPLSSQVLSSVLDRMLAESNTQYLRQGISVELNSDARDYFLRKGFDARFGARPLRQRLLKDLDSPLADLLASGGIPPGSRIEVRYTGTDEHGKALDFYYEEAPELLRRAEELRAAEVGRSSHKDRDSVPSVSLDTDHGLAAESSNSSSSSGGSGGGNYRRPRPTTRRSSRS
jgi:hypothetical protein